MADAPRDRDLCEPEELARLMRAGDLEALERMTHCYGERLESVGRRYCRDQAMAEDAVQEAILSAGMRLADFRGEGSVASWLASMVANACRHMRRGRKNDPGLHVEYDHEQHGAPAPDMAGPSPALSPEDEVARGQLLRLLGQALLHLDPRDRSLILLSDAEGWNAPELAQALDMTPGQVRTRLSRARKRLREHLGPLRDAFAE